MQKYIVSILLLAVVCQAGVVDNAGNGCKPFCPSLWSPVCGSDGKDLKLFDNDCLFDVDVCKNNRTLTKIDNKWCTSEPVHLFDIVGNYDFKKGNCQQICDRAMFPVCASNEKKRTLVSNPCYIEFLNCVTKPTDDASTFRELQKETCVYANSN